MNFVGHHVYRTRDSKGSFQLKRSVNDASLASVEWMDVLGEREEIHIFHMFNGKEYLTT